MDSSLQYTLMSSGVIASANRVEISKTEGIDLRDEGEEYIPPFRSYRKAVLDMNAEPVVDEKVAHAPTYTLLRNYRANTGEKGRIDSKPKQLKFKYDVQVDTHQRMQSEVKKEIRQPLSEYKQPCSGEFYKKRTSFNSIRKDMNHFEYLFHTASHRPEAQSIIFDSKVRPFDSPNKPSPFPTALPSDPTLLHFTQKVQKVNTEIESSLSNLETMLQELKKQKIAQSVINMQKKISQQVMEKEREYELDREREIQRMGVELRAREVEVEEARKRRERQERQERELQKLAERKAKMEKQRLEREEKDKKDRQQREKHQKQLFQQQQKQMQELLHQNKANLPTTKDSQIQLPTPTTPTFPPEYTTFITRLTTQIHIDIEFTNMVYDLTKSQQLPPIRQILFTQMAKHQQNGQINTSFFQMEPSELDPLDRPKPPKPLTEDQQRDLALSLYKKYKQIESHFTLKLKARFPQPTLNLLFEELSKFNFTKLHLEDSNSVTVGHLLSYLNMRTNSSFRNRSFVKMMKRLGLQSSGFLTVESLKVLVSV